MKNLFMILMIMLVLFVNPIFIQILIQIVNLNQKLLIQMMNIYQIMMRILLIVNKNIIVQNVENILLLKYILI